MKKLLSLFLAMMMLLTLAACGGETVAETTVPETPAETAAENVIQFTFLVVDASGAETSFDISTTKATVGEALLEEGLIAGEESEYGLYVKTVNGITADYDVDGTYWAFYIDGEYAMTGVDATEAVAGATYMFKVEGGETTDDANILGEGATAFTFTVTDVEGNETVYTIQTNETIVGTALQNLGLIEGEMGDYGLYVKTVCGTTLDWDTDGKYWAFYIDGEYAMTGVDATEIVPGAAYAMKAE